MNCKKCGISVMKTMLHRTNLEGQVDAGWMCMLCIKKTEVELYKNIVNEDNFKVVKDLQDLIYKNK